MGGFIARVVKYTHWRRVRRSLFMPRGQHGFTIIEVLIVLAVTGLLFASAAILIAGRRQQTEFNQSVRNVQSQIQQVINDVATGFYPNTNSFECSAGPSGPVLTSGGGTQQGANTGCIFLGKAIQFGVVNTSPEQFSVFTIAGLQKGASGNEVTSLTEAQPRAVAKTTTSSALPDITVDQQLLGGLTAIDMWYDNGAGVRTVGVVGFITTLAQYSGGTILSGTQQVNVIPVDDNSVDSALGRSNEAAADALDTSLATSVANPSSGVFICFKSGGTNQSGLITIGNKGRQLSVTLDIKSNLDCS